MHCLSRRKRFKHKHPVWEDPADKKLDEPTGLVDGNLEDANRSGNRSHSECLSDSDSDSDTDSEHEIAAGDVRSRELGLEGATISYKHVTNLNNDRSFNGSVKQVQFNPSSRIAFVTLSSGQLDLFEVDGERNRYIQNVRIPFAREPYCSFTPDGESIVISSDNYRGKFFAYDMLGGCLRKYALRVGKESREMSDFRIHGDYMACRREGSQDVMVLSSKTYENAFALKLNEPARAVQFSGSNEIFIAGENANIYVWDLRKTSLCKHRFRDFGSVHATSFALSSSSGSLSVGSDCGTVNTYNLEDCLASRNPTPLKSFANIKTPVEILEYNRGGELLLFGSRQQIEGFRLSNTVRGTVYRNFPVSVKKYGRLASACFSPLSGYLALGCSTGRAHLLRIPYYKSY